MQSGGYDCRLFSIAFATALVFGEQPGCFLFDQKEMRDHLLQCLERQQMSMFPIMKRRCSGAKVKLVEEIPYTVFSACQNCRTRSGSNSLHVKSVITLIHVYKCLNLT